MTQEQLAEQCEVSTAYIGEIEIGRKFPSHTLFDRIATALSIKPYKLLLPEADIEAFDRQELVMRLCERLEKEISRSIRLTMQDFLS
jgi:transcriptional regulator with XRE-family HTH domain